MNANCTLEPGATLSAAFAAPNSAKTMWPRFKVFGSVGLAAALLWTQSAAAFNVTPLSQGHLESGQVVLIVQITLDPGETVPWHYHTGRAIVTVISGTLTEDVGCGTPMAAYAAGTAFTETAGHVHRLFNLGQVQVVFTGVAIFPACDPNVGTVFVNEPQCKGKSGRSHLEEIPDCND